MTSSSEENERNLSTRRFPFMPVTLCRGVKHKTEWFYYQSRQSMGEGRARTLFLKAISLHHRRENRGKYLFWDQENSRIEYPIIFKLY